jgi:hypothetical protein
LESRISTPLDEQEARTNCAILSDGPTRRGWHLFVNIFVRMQSES